MTTVAMLAAILALAGCGGAPEAAGTGRAALAQPQAPVLDLIEVFPLAEIRRERARFELGTAAARPHLVSGWGTDEADDRQRPFVWGLGEASVLDFDVVRPVDVTLALTCGAYADPAAAPQRIAVAVNGAAVGSVEVGTEVERHRLPLPAAYLRPGANRLTLRYAWSRRPSEVDGESDDARPLAVMWRAIELEGLGAEGVPRPEEAAAGRRLLIPAGAELSYYLEARAAGALRIAAVGASGSRAVPLRLVVTAEVPGSAASQVASVAPVDGAPLDVALPAPREGPLRLTLAAERLPSDGVSGALRRLAGWAGGLFGASGPPAVALRQPEVVGRPPTPRQVPAAPPPREPAGRRPNILVYLVDTLRADHLGLFGYPRPTTPHLDRFAADAVVFDDARAQSSWTRTAVTSIFTGLNPQVHGVNGRLDALPESFDTLAEHLQRAGYATWALVTNGNVDRRFGLAQGFAEYRRIRESRSRPEIHALSDTVDDRFFYWLDEVWPAAGNEAPFFAYLHVTDPHAPYMPRSPYRERFAPGVAAELGRIDNVRGIAKGEIAPPPGVREAFIGLYDGEVAFLDAQFGRLVDHLRARGLYDTTLILFIADHGEEFFDHGGWEHGHTLYAEQLHIPLLIRLPGGEGAGRRIGAVARQVDVLPTLLQAAGIAPPDGLDGRSLLPVVRGEDDTDPVSYAFLELDDRVVESARLRGWKLIEDRTEGGGGGEMLFHHLGDPTELHDLRRERGFEAGYLRQSLRALRFALRRRALTAPQQVEIDDELAERLRALGYLN